MLGKSLACPLLTYNYAPQVLFSNPDVATTTLNNVKSHSQNAVSVAWTLSIPSKKWILQSTTQIGSLAFTEEDKKTWEACREAVSTFNFSSEEADKIIGKAFGQVHSPYWGEERKMVVPKLKL